MTINEFKKLGLSPNVIKVLEEEKFEKPTEIQELTIPLVLDGKDIIARASTGSGKTLAFGSTILQNTKKDFGIQALILTPTRELAEQDSKALKKFSKYKPLEIISVYGGVSINPQIKNLEYADIVVGTPGRILDHLSRRTIDLKCVKTLVLDEADRMLDMGFIKDVEKIISQCPKNRQTLLFSATISEDIVRLSKRYMTNQMEISAEEYVDEAKLIQIYYDTDDNLKYSVLKHLLQNEESKLVMVFCNTRRNVDFVANNLKAMGVEALAIHGGFSQEKRNTIMNKFHSQKCHVLICTDVAARGLDIKGVSHIYNYDIPKEAKEYIHRIGRTARAGKEGKVINIVSRRDYDNFSSVLKDDSLKITCEKTPFVERTMIKWIPERRGRDGRFSSRTSGGRSRGFSSRSDSGGRSYSRDKYPRSRDEERPSHNRDRDDKVPSRNRYPRSRDEERPHRDRSHRDRDDRRPRSRDSRNRGTRDSRSPGNRNRRRRDSNPNRRRY